MKKETITINAMMEDDMKETLKKWGYWKSLKRGEIKCVCGEVVTEDNLAAIKGDKENKRVNFYHSIVCVNN